ncbi:hypothetical protein QZH41_010836 [Actinostola sp. cb2023]|nr:hypothetical protein QZH41_010836 [Actinostola sp. cb2023]
MADEEEERGGYRWLNQYERTWEAIREDDEGSLQSMVDDLVHRNKRKRAFMRTGNVRLGMMLENFITEYFDQNPISQLGVIITKNKRAEKLTELSGNPKLHINAINKNCVPKSCQGEPSLQNTLSLAAQSLRHMPGHSSKEVLIVFGSLTSCDPGDIGQTIQNVASQNIRCSIIGLAAEMKICKTICSQTQGTYRVILDERHYKELLMQQVIPPTAKVRLYDTHGSLFAGSTNHFHSYQSIFVHQLCLLFQADSESALIRMGSNTYKLTHSNDRSKFHLKLMSFYFIQGFPQHIAKGPPSFCMCHLDSSNSSTGLNTKGYFCPQCQSKYCDLPVECKVCSLTLVSAPHLARSYQHLFPFPQFEEIYLPVTTETSKCQACQIILKEKSSTFTDMYCLGQVSSCPDCNQVFCLDCDAYIHESLHACPGCVGSNL